ncbi:hypothetical protein Ndes2526B_g04747 [Nannochloris sp. 'desiccata']
MGHLLQETLRSQRDVCPGGLLLEEHGEIIINSKIIWTYFQRRHIQTTSWVVIKVAGRRRLALKLFKRRWSATATRSGYHLLGWSKPSTSKYGGDDDGAELFSKLGVDLLGTKSNIGEKLQHCNGSVGNAAAAAATAPAAAAAAAAPAAANP